MKLNLSADDVLTTTRSVRKRLDLDTPVERDVVEEALTIAMQAPTGSNRQGWHWIVVDDAAKKTAIADIYRENFRGYAALAGPTYREGDTRGERQDAVKSSAQYLADVFDQVPLMVIPCIWAKLDGVDVATGASAWGSILPAVWSFMLALRERGLGSAWTTLHLPNGGEERTAEILGIPFDKVTQAGLFPVAYTKGTDFQPAKRQPLADVLHWNSW